MTPWLLRAVGSFPSGVTLAIGWPGGLDQPRAFIYRLKGEAVVDDYPAEVAALLAKALRNTQAETDLCRQLAGVVPRLATHANSADYVALCNEAARLGCQEAPYWGTLGGREQ